MKPTRLQAGRNPRKQPGHRALVFGATIAGALATAAMPVPAPRLVWNASASAPVGLYWRVPGAPFRGDQVLAWAPVWARKMAAERGYLPLNVPLVKHVAATAGDIVCASGAAISIGGLVVARRRANDSRGRSLYWWEGCQYLRNGEVFLLMADAPDSFDGRYFGVTEGRDIIGRLVPLWTW